MSNNKQVLESVSPENRASSVVDLNNRELPIHKTLGVFWDADQDCFRFKIKVQKQPCTRRGLFSMISQTYDPKYRENGLKRNAGTKNGTFFEKYRRYR